MTLIDRIRGQNRRTRARLTSRATRDRLSLEELEARITPTVIFHPYFGVEATTHGTGEKLNNTPVELIFWGSTYWNNPSGASASTIANAIATLLSGPSYQHLAQYGAGASPYLANWWIDTDRPDPKPGFTDADLRNEIVKTINDINAPIFAPEFFTSTPLYMVITPYGTGVDESTLPHDSTAGNRAALGYHFDWDASTSFGNYNLVYGWVGQPLNLPGLGGTLSNLDTITSVFSHESSEAMTDAQPFSGITCYAGRFLPGGGHGEIGDFEPEWFNLDDYRVNGVLVQAMWDDNAQAFTVSDGKTQHVDLYANYSQDLFGSYTYTGSTLDVYGDQSGAGANDFITVDTTSTGGVQITLNAETFAFEPGVNITQINVYPGSGTNTINVHNTPSGCTTSINGQGGHDIVTVGSRAPSLGGTLAGILGPVSVQNTTGASDLWIDDSGDPTPRFATLDPGSLTWSYAPYAAPITWTPTSGATGGVDLVHVYGGSGGNRFTVNNTSAMLNPTYLDSGLGGDWVDIIGTTGKLNLNGDGGSDIVRIGQWQSSLATVRGAISVANTYGSTELSIDDSADTTGRTATIGAGALTWTNYAPPITWVTKTATSGGVVSLQADFGSGGNTITVAKLDPFGNDLFGYGAIISTGTGNDSLNIQATQCALDVINNGGADYVSVGSAAPYAGGTLGGILGPINIAYSNGVVYLYVDDSGDKTGRTATLGAGSLTWTNYAPPITWIPTSSGTYGGVNYLSVTGGSGGNTWTVNDTNQFYYNTDLYPGTGHDAVNITKTTGTLWVRNDGGNDTVVLGSAAPATSGGTTAAIQGEVKVVGNPAGSTSVVMDDSADTIARTVYMLSGDVQGLAGYGHINYTGSIRAVTVNCGVATNTIDVWGTQAGTVTTLNAGTGNDTINVGNGANTLDDIQGALYVNGQAGTDALNLIDTGKTTGQTYTLGGDSVGRVGTALVLYSTVESLVVNAAVGADTFNVQSAPITATTLNGNGAGDTIIGPYPAYTTNTWLISGLNSGSVGNVTFSNVANLTGGPYNDTFQFSGSGRVSGVIKGGGYGTEKLDYSALAMNVTVNLQAGTAPLMAGFSGINAVVAGASSNSTLVGPNTDNSWAITATNSGMLNAGMRNAVSFTNFRNLTGGTGRDVFRPSNGVGVTGTIDGGPGPGQNWLDDSAYTTAVVINLAAGTATNIGSLVNIHNARAGSGGSTMTGDSTGGVLVGGAGADTIRGGAGRSILIGGAGADSVTGGSGDDIVIGGTTSYDGSFAALEAILAEWQSADSYATRVSKIRTGVTGGYKLVNGTTVHDDAAVDTLTGGPGADWFFQGAGDVITDRAIGELVN
jgi:hypothetical protein